MYVVEVIPLSRGSSVGSLTYYSTVAYAPGAVLTIPVRSQEVRGLVVESHELSAMKAAVRAATFSLRKLPEQTNPSSLSPLIVETAKALAERTPATLGAILFSLLPEEVREGRVELTPPPAFNPSSVPADISIMSAPTADRLDAYRSQIREAFAHRSTVLLVVPASAYVESVAAALSVGISERVITFSSTDTEKKLQRSYTALRDLSTAKLIVTTPEHAFIDRHDISLTIVDQARSPHYKGRTRPYLDLRTTLATMASIAGRRLIFGDILNRPEDEWRRRADIYQTEGEHQRRIAFDNQLQFIKMNDEPTGGQPFRLFSPELETAIDKALAEKELVFLYAARRGLAPVVACNDCGHIFRCPDSGSPYSLFRTFDNGVEKRWFLSATSGRRVKAAEVCPNCGSWRLGERGIGIQHIYDELCTRWPKEKIVLFDHTTAKTPRRAKQLMADFYDQKGAILLGTAMAIPYIEESVLLSAVVSADAARTVPTWRADEEFFSLLLTLREITTGAVFVQSRNDPDQIIEYAKTGQIEKFYDEELKLRQALSYPPFSVFVHLTLSGLVDSVKALEVQAMETLARWQPVFYSAPESVAEKTTRYALIKIPTEDWPDRALRDALLSLPPSIRIEIDPARIV